MSRLLDVLTGRSQRFGMLADDDYAWTQLVSSYGSPDQERIQPTFLMFAGSAFGGNSIVYALVSRRVNFFSEATFKYRALSDKHLFGDPSLAKLENPWPNGTTGELLARAEQDASLAGNFYLRDAGDRLERLRPDWVTIVSHITIDDMGRSVREVVGYLYEPVGDPDRKSELYLVDEVAHWCADEETEILTAEGWKTYATLNAGDEVLTLNHETGLSEWQPVIEKMVFQAIRREMVSMEGNEFSSLTTPNHRWPAEYRISRAKTYGRRWVTSGTIGAGDRIPVAAQCADMPSEPKWSDALVEAVAWFWTEGRFASGSKPGTKGRGISIAQSAKNAGNVERIRAALRALFGAPVDRMPKKGPRAEQVPCWRESVDDDMLIFHLSANASDVITAQAPGKVASTAFLRSLTLAQLELFIQVSMLADNNGVSRLAQKSPAMAEQFALACILSGRAVSIKDGGSKKRGYRMTNVRMLRKRHVYPQESGRERSQFRVRRVEYDGHVWCPRTQNQTWLARRAGSVYFTGNSPMPDPLANFRGMSWLTPVVRDVNADVSMTAHREAFFRNAATPNLIVKYQQRLNQDQRDRVRDAIAARHAGPRNAFGTLVLDAGADLTVVGDRMQGSAFVELQAAGEIRLASAAGVPGIVAGLQQGRQTGAPGEYADAVRGFADLTIRPNWRSICAALEKFTKPPQGCQLWFDTADISALQPGEKDSAGTMQVQAGTTNTLIMAGYEPDAVVQAVSAGDLTLLAGKHSGLTSVQMHKPGDAEPADNPPPAAAAGDQGGGEATDEAPPAKAGRHRRFDPEEPRDPDGEWSKVGAEVKHLLTDERFDSLYPPHEDHTFGDGGHVRVDEGGEITVAFKEPGGWAVVGDGISPGHARRISRNLDWAADAAADADSGDYDDAEEAENGLIGWAVDGKDGSVVGFSRDGDVRFGWPNGDGTYGSTAATGTYDEFDMSPRSARQMSRVLARAADQVDDLNADDEGDGSE